MCGTGFFLAQTLEPRKPQLGERPSRRGLCPGHVACREPADLSLRLLDPPTDAVATGRPAVLPPREALRLLRRPLPCLLSGPRIGRSAIGESLQGLAVPLASVNATSVNEESSHWGLDVNRSGQPWKRHVLQIGVTHTTYKPDSLPSHCR